MSSGQEIRDLVPPNVRLLHLSANPPIGRMRNAGCEIARGEVIAHFDDDDYSAPGRLADQLRRLRTTGAAVTGYHSMRFTDGRRWWLYRGAAGYALGTSLVYRRDWWQLHPFQELRVGEDNAFVRAAGHRLVSADAGELMFATNHSGNTSPRQLATKQWQEIAA